MPILLLALVACGTPEPVAPGDRAAAVPASTGPDAPADVDARHRALREQLRALVGDLEKAGRYDCCIENPCNTCAMRMGGCKCGEGLRRGEPVCEECAMMWRSGQGDEPGVDPASVRSFLEAQREMEARAKASVAPADAAATLTPPAEPVGCACPGHATGAKPAAATPAAATPATPATPAAAAPPPTAPAPAGR